MTWLYNLSLFFYHRSVRIAAMFGHAKAKQWVNGRRTVFEHLREKMLPGERRVWFHCASLGEFEQGRPVMEKFKIQNPGIRIVLTFFSPSGYEIRKNYQGADHIFYLPEDTRAHAAKFISLVQPEKVFFVKYEYWFHYFNQLGNKNIPLYIVSAVFRPQQKFFRWYGGFFRKMLKAVTCFFVQDPESGALLQSIGLTNYRVTGDTRFDRVAEVAENSKQYSLVEKFKNGRDVLICGSSWEQDEQLLIPMLRELKAVKASLKLIIAPHEINEKRIDGLMKMLSELYPVKLSEAKEDTIASSAVLVIDNIGMLSSLYRYGTFAYIGGGFGSGIHNMLEAAVFGMPVFFGPNFQKFNEAKELIKEGGAFSIHSSAELKNMLMGFLDDRHKITLVSVISKQYVLRKKGATEQILRLIKENN